MREEAMTVDDTARIVSVTSGSHGLKRGLQQPGVW